MGETSGALIGGVMVIGLVLGREELENIQAYRDTMEASYKLYYRFKEELESTICFEIQKSLLGRSFDFKIDEEAEGWYKAGGLEKCPMVCAIAARIAADIILTLHAFQAKQRKGTYDVFIVCRLGSKNVLVDTAIEAEDYRNYYPGFNNVPFEPVQTFEQALGRVGCVPDDIDIIIQTHLHIDHIYNTLKCKNAVIYVQEEGLQFALNPHPIFELVYPREIIKDLNFEVIKGDQTILPGIAVMLVPGHAPACQAVVDATKGKAVISGFCCIMENFNPPEDVKTKISPFASYPVIVPGIHVDLFQAYESVFRGKQMADIIIPMHDPDMALLEQIP